MALLIDGYNLLHASGILGRGVGPGSLERSRGALIRFLSESLDDSVLRRTTVVFDAREAPPGLPREQKQLGLTVRFAEPGSDADALIEQLIASDSSPRRLTVVSSDHRLHKAARRRNATAIDSDRWYAETLRKRIARQKRDAGGAKPSGPMTEAEVSFWLKEFGLVPPEGTDDAKSPPAPTSRNPFPPGYGEDLRDDEA
jgi:predicted RNA-binding protein with PIN domain